MKIAIQKWEQAKQGKRDRPRTFSDLAIITAFCSDPIEWIKMIFYLDLYRFYSAAISYFS